MGLTWEMQKLWRQKYSKALVIGFLTLTVAIYLLRSLTVSVVENAVSYLSNLENPRKLQGDQASRFAYVQYATTTEYLCNAVELTSAPLTRWRY